MDEERKETNTEDEKEEIKVPTSEDPKEVKEPVAEDEREKVKAPTEEEPRNKKRNKKKILKSLGRNLLLVGMGFFMCFIAGPLCVESCIDCLACSCQASLRNYYYEKINAIKPENTEYVLLTRPRRVEDTETDFTIRLDDGREFKYDIFDANSFDFVWTITDGNKTVKITREYMIEKNKAYKYFCYMWEDYYKDYNDETVDYKGVANMIILITGYDNKLFIVTWEDQSYSKYRYELPFQLYLFDFYEETIEYCGYLDHFAKDPKHKICIGKNK